jgi:ribokinase
MAERTPALPLLVVGSVNMDLVLQAERFPQGGETLLGERYSYIPGGKGANQAVAAARLGLAVSFVGRVGGDAHGPTLKRNLAREGIDVELLAVDAGRQTGFAAIMVEPHGENRIVVFPGANMALEEGDLDRAFEGRSYAAAMINLEIPEQVVLGVCRRARERRLPVILDAGPVRKLDFHRLQGLEIISPNESETRAITGLPCGDPEQAARAAARLLEITGSRYAVLKLGERGALLYPGEGGGAQHVPPFQVKAVDSTAAGDAFTAAMTAHYLRHGTLAEAVRYANAAAALSVTRLGAQPSMPTAAEVERFLGRGEAPAGQARGERQGP